MIIYSDDDDGMNSYYESNNNYLKYMQQMMTERRQREQQQIINDPNIRFPNKDGQLKLNFRSTLFCFASSSHTCSCIYN